MAGGISGGAGGIPGGAGGIPGGAGGIPGGAGGIPGGAGGIPGGAGGIPGGAGGIPGGAGGIPGGSGGWFVSSSVIIRPPNCRRTASFHQCTAYNHCANILNQRVLVVKKNGRLMRGSYARETWLV